MNNKRNLTFSYLEAVAILMVIDDHTGTHINILANIFPYNSFYMPLFVFISGYFYKKGIKRNIKNKIKHLFVPYMICTLAGNGIAYLMDKANIVHWYECANIRSIWQWITTCPPSTTSAAWFAIMLVWVSVAYNIVRGILRSENKYIEYLLLVIMICIGGLSIHYCMLGYNTNLLYLPCLRMMFYIQFYHMGVLFRKYWEPYINKMRAGIICSICIFINLLLFSIYGSNLAFPSTCWMGSFKSYYLPIITSITGILFWYRLLKDFTERYRGSIKIIDFLAENTFLIMESHLFFINIPCFYTLCKISMRGIETGSFNRELFETTPWVGENGNIFSFFTGLIGSMIFIYTIKRIRNKIKQVLCK